MIQEQYITKRKKEQHLTLVERGKIETFLKTGMTKLYNYIHKKLFINFSEEDMIYKKKRRKQK